MLGAKAGRTRRKVFYFTTHSTHFYLRLCGFRHMVKDNCCHYVGYSFQLAARFLFICTISQTGYHILQPLIHQLWSTSWNKKYGLLFSISRKIYFICIISQTGYHIPQPLIHQLWSTSWNKKWLNGSTMRNQAHEWMLYH